MYMYIYIYIYIHIYINFLKKMRRKISVLEASVLQPRPLVTGLCDLSANLGRTGRRTQRMFTGKGVLVQ